MFVLFYTKIRLGKPTCQSANYQTLFFFFLFSLYSLLLCWSCNVKLNCDWIGDPGRNLTSNFLTHLLLITQVKLYQFSEFNTKFENKTNSKDDEISWIHHHCLGNKLCRELQTTFPSYHFKGFTSQIITLFTRVNSL